MSKPMKENNVSVSTNNGSINIGDTYINQKVIRNNKVIPNPDIHITNEQLSKIKGLVDKYVSMVANEENRKKIYPQTWKYLYKELGVTSYHLIYKSDYNKAILLLNKLIGSKGRKGLKDKDPESAKKYDIRSIQAIRRKLGISDEELLQIAMEHLELKRPIASIKELSLRRIRKLYEKIMSIKQS